MSYTPLDIIALICLIPVAISPFRRSVERDNIFWLALAVAIAGTAVWIFVRQSTGWWTGLSTALWLTILTCLVLHSVICFYNRDAWRLSPLLFPYLLVLGTLALIWGQAPGNTIQEAAPMFWIGTHILVSIITYGLVTLAAIAALAAAIQHSAIRSKKRNYLSNILPPVSSSENLLVQLLIAGELILGLGLLTGMAVLYFTSGQLLIFDHKFTLVVSVFIVLAILLLLHFKSGFRGKVATRLVLLAYLLFTLGYPGVKFVTHVILGSN